MCKEDFTCNGHQGKISLQGRYFACHIMMPRRSISPRWSVSLVTWHIAKCGIIYDDALITTNDFFFLQKRSSVIMEGGIGQGNVVMAGLHRIWNTKPPISRTCLLSIR